MTLKVELRPSSEPVALLFHNDGGDHLGDLRAALAAERIERRPAEALLEGAAAEVPGVLLADCDLAARYGEAIRRLPPHVVTVALGAEAERLLGPSATVTLSGHEPAEAFLRALRTSYELAAARFMAERMERELARTRDELSELHRIGIALMTERDQDKLLRIILTQAKRLTASDAGSLYLVEKDEQGHQRLRFKLTENDSLPDLPFSEFTLPITAESISGYAALTGQPVIIDDCYEIPPEAPYKFNPAIDKRFGYRTKTILVVPMLDHRDDVVGVLQLLNRKSEPNVRIVTDEISDAYCLPYTDREKQLVLSLAGQAAVSIENSQLYAQIQQLFEAFVRAAVTAIDQRDPTTAGHSIRVASLTTDIAGVLERVEVGRYRGTKFTRDQMRELRYAAMLHDFGKVAVREETLVKPKKLPSLLWERVQARFELIQRTVEAEYYRKRAELVLGGQQQLLRELDEQHREHVARVREFARAVHAANEPTVLPEQAAGVLVEIAQHTYERPDGTVAPYLSGDELHFLQIPRGTLDERERLEIESHVEQTYRFLTQIPWTEDLQNLPLIAYGHHEKLNGSGYPRKVTGDEIPVQSRIMTIADIFDALTASDRPYKKAVPLDKALSIIETEAKQGMLDEELVRIMIEGQIYRRVLEEDWRQL